MQSRSSSHTSFQSSHSEDEDAAVPLKKEASAVGLVGWLVVVVKCSTEGTGPEGECSCCRW